MKLIITGFPPFSLVYWHCHKSVRIPHILESNPHPFSSFRGQKIRRGLESCVD